MALAPWNVLASGKIRSDEEEERRRQTGEKGRTLDNVSTDWQRNEKEKTVCKALEKVAAEIGAKHITSGMLSINFKIIFFLQLADVSSSRHCISHAEGTLCLPDCGRSEGRAFAGQYRGFGNHVEQ
jgi:hypothetical protein